MKKTFLAAITLLFTVMLLSSCQKSIDLSPRSDDLSMGAAHKNGNGTIWVMTVHLAGTNEVPSNSTGATGIAILRLTNDKVLHSKVIVDVPEGVGTLTASHIHQGAAGINGPVRIFLCHNADEFGLNIATPLTDAQYTILTTAEHLYVNAHSTVYPGGLVRGQIR